MATGYEDYVTYQYTSPALALDRAQLHLMKLMEMQGPSTGADWTTYNPMTLDSAIASVRKDIERLAAQGYGIGKPRLVPTVRSDPLPIGGMTP